VRRGAKLLLLLLPSLLLLRPSLVLVLVLLGRACAGGCG
jgi:hypothetical protein